MLSNGAISQEQPAPNSQAVTVEEVHRQQRIHLAMRALDLEAENYLLQQEVQRLTARVEELEGRLSTRLTPGGVGAHADP